MGDWLYFESDSLIEEHSKSILSYAGEVAKSKGFNYKYISEENEKGEKEYYFVAYINEYEHAIKNYKKLYEKKYKGSSAFIPCGVYSRKVTLFTQFSDIYEIITQLDAMEVMYNLYKRTDYKIPECCNYGILDLYKDRINKERDINVRNNFDFVDKLLYLESLNDKERKNVQRKMDRELTDSKAYAKKYGAYDESVDTRGKILNEKIEHKNNISLKELSKFGDTYTIFLNQKTYGGVKTELEKSNILYNLENIRVTEDSRIVQKIDNSFSRDELYEYGTFLTYLKKDEKEIIKFYHEALFHFGYLMLPHRHVYNFKDYLYLTVNVNWFKSFFALMQQYNINIYLDYDDSEFNGLDFIPVIINGCNAANASYILENMIKNIDITTYNPEAEYQVNPKIFDIINKNCNKKMIPANLLSFN